MDENIEDSAPKKPEEDNYESDSSADSSDDEKCPICLLSFSSDQEIGKPAVCEHSFCFPCIQEWSKVVQTCPIDRKQFNEIRVFGNLESDELLRTVAIKDKVKLDEFINAEEFTACEICGNTDREDCMLLCDGCDKGYHMDCLDPPILEVPQGNWYCDDCFNSSDESDDEDEEEVDDLINDAEEEIGDLPMNRLRTRQQPQILRTSQSERIRNAILARMSLRGTREALGEGPSTSASVATRAAPRRRTTRRRATRRRTKTVVVEYEVDGSDKFAMRKKRVTVRRKKSRRKKKRRVARRKPAKTAKSCTGGPSTSFKGVNANVHDLQRGRMLAGVSNFNIFEPSNMLDYVPDEDNIDDSGIEVGGGVLTQPIISLNNPQRRNLMIKNRVQNCTATSSSVDLLGSIMQDQDLFGPGSIGNRFAVEKSSGKLVFKGEGVKKSADGNSSGDPPSNQSTSEPANSNPTPNPPADENVTESSEAPQEVNANPEIPNESQNLPNESFESVDKRKKPKKPEIDMFDENPEEPLTDDCPIFSIYDSVNVDVDQENSSNFNRQTFSEENADLVQMSDPEDAPPAIVASQPASPDVEVDKVGERSYTPPIAQKTSDDGPDRDDDDNDKRKKDSKRNRKRESSVKRYSVRDRLKERSPVRLKDKFGRNRSRSSSRKKRSRRRSRSRSPDRYRRSLTRSRSRRRTPSIDYDRRKRKDKKKSNKRSRSRSLTPRGHRATTPERRGRSKSKKAKKKKHRDYSKEKPSTLTKEVFTSGQNILVSVNFNNQDDKASKAEDREPKDIVDITAKKKITVSSKPVAIIDLARSPFRELTPEYQSNIIELSDSDGEKNSEKRPPKSPDSSSKLYDPFDILNSPTNENVTSSQNTAGANAAKLPEKNSEPVKIGANYNKNVMAMATGGNLFSSFEENLVSSSSQQPPLPASKNDDKNASKIEAVPMDIAESPYSPGHDYDDSFQHEESESRGQKNASKGANIFEDLFGSTTPPGLEKSKSGSKKTEKNVDSNKYLMKMKRQERVVEEVKLVIKPYYSKRTITKEQYKEILRKAVPKICHSREINPQKIKVLIDSYVKIFKHRKKRAGLDESF